MTDDEYKAALRGAAYMKEKIAQAIGYNPRDEIAAVAGHVRKNIRLPEKVDVEKHGTLVDNLLKDEGVW